jgi:hypothetical protein
MFMDRIDVNTFGWEPHRFIFPGSNIPVVAHAFEKDKTVGKKNPQTNMPYPAGPNGDAVRINLIAHGTVRMSAYDGVTRNADAFPGIEHPDVAAKDIAVEVIPYSDSLISSLLNVNRRLHSREHGVESLGVCVTVADVTIRNGKLSAQLVRAGDCEFYVFRETSGWEIVLGDDMLTDEARAAFEALKAELHPEMNRVREALGIQSAEFTDLNEEFQRREAELLGPESNWRSLPLGRYSTEDLRARGFMQTRMRDAEAILLTTDGTHKSDDRTFIDVLGDVGHPSKFTERFWDSRREGWNDLASATMYIDR